MLISLAIGVLVIGFAIIGYVIWIILQTGGP
jgi:hypothetical protein